MGVPREIGREFRWIVTWDHLIDAEESSVDAQSAVESSLRYFPAETDRHFSLIDGDTGNAVASGLKTQVFHASPHAMINQAIDAPRWAVQSWDGSMLRVVPRRGTPRLHGATLLQFASTAVVYGDVVTTGERWRMDLPQNPTVYDLVDDVSGGDWFAVGTLGGAVAVTDGEREWDYVGESGPSNAEVSAIYGIRMVSDGRSAATMADRPSVYILHNLDPQLVSRLDFAEAGGGTLTQIGEVSGDFAVRGPRRLLELGENVLVIGLKDALYVARPRDAASATIPVAGMRELTGIGRSRGSLAIATANGRSGSFVLVGAPDMTEVAYWELADGSSLAWTSDLSPSASIVVVQQDNRLVGLEIGL
jgi:hypothetical protein